MKQPNSPQNKNSMWKYVVDAAAVIGCLGTIIFGYLAIKVGRDTMQDARNIARETGAFDKPDLRLLLGSEEVETVFPTKVYLGAPVMKGNTINLGKLTLIVANKGKKTAKNIGITDQFPKMGRPGFNELLKIDIGGFLPSKSEIQQEIKEIGNFSYSYFNIPMLNPGQAMSFESAFLLEETEFEDEVELRDKSKIRYQVRFGLMEEITLSAEDLLKSAHPLTIQVVSARNAKELEDKVAQISLEELRKKRKELSFPTSMLAPLETKAFVAFTEPTLIYEKEGLKLYQYEFRPETIALITTYNKPNTKILWLSVFALLATIAGSIILFGYIKRKRALKKSGD
jgi:hypothetical protein